MRICKGNSFIYFFVFLVTIVLYAPNCQAQQIVVDSTMSDSASNNKIVLLDVKHSPRKATLMSAALPGLGQIYNRKIWKVPIIYVLAAALGAFVYDNATLEGQFKAHFNFMKEKELANSPPKTVRDIYGREYDLTGATKDNLKFYIDKTQRQKQLNIIGLVAIYALNIIDANVDAHLYDFKISDDLSLHWQPQYQFNPNIGSTVGLAVQLKLHYANRNSFKK